MKAHSTEKQQQSQDNTFVANENQLVLWNDDFNTFDFVIDTLIEVCGHTPEQAEQCTLLVHYKGKCTVKTSSMEVLKPMHKELINRGLTSEIL